MAAKTFDCVVCGSCVADFLVRPVPLDRPLGKGALIRTQPLAAAVGGLVSNAGTALTRLGLRTAVFSRVGDDEWGALIRRRYEQEGLDTTALLTHATAPTSTTAVLIDAAGERSFAHCVGAPQTLDLAAFTEHLELFRRSRLMLVGYYSLMPALEPDLPALFRRLRTAGCATAMDAAGTGGSLEPLARILPELDVYVPSHAEATRQAGEADPRRIIDRYRACEAPGLLGVKLGARGALLSPRPRAYVEIPAVRPPGEVVDTTGAGDAFYAGLLAGLLRGMKVAQAGRLAAAAGACCVTAVGATAGLRSFAETARLAGL